MQILVDAINEKYEKEQTGDRAHLGASQIGDPCLRKLVYSFRHAITKLHAGRMLRLFERGHIEEPRFISYLRSIGFEVQEFAERLTYHDGSGSYATIPWEQDLGDLDDVHDQPHHVLIAKAAGVKLKQWSFKEFGGHFSGSSDGRLVLPAWSLRKFNGIPIDQPLLSEFKTYNTKAFTELQRIGMELNYSGAVKKFRPVHYTQMQVYMNRKGLLLALYMAVNKNDDDLYIELVPYDEAHALEAIAKAQQVIAARTLPPRLSESPSWFNCKYCDYRQPCHYGSALEKKCRTCKNAVAVEDQRWHCAKWDALIPVDAMPLGCDSWSPISD